MTWHGQDIVGFDTETTGVNTAQDRVVTAAIVHTGPGLAEPQVHSWLLNPGIPIPDGAAEVHGITTEYAATHGVPPGPALEEIAQTLVAAAQSGAVLVAYNASFDFDLLNAELVRYGLADLPTRLAGTELLVLDPLVLDRKLDRYRKGRRTLGAIAEHYRITAEGLHNAEADVAVTLEVLRTLLSKYPELTEMSRAELMAYQAAAHREWAENFNQWRSSKGLPGPGAELTWLGSMLP